MILWQLSSIWMKILNDICMQLELNWIQIHWMKFEFNWMLINLNFKFNQFKFNNWIKFQLNSNSNWKKWGAKWGKKVLKICSWIRNWSFCLKWSHKSKRTSFHASLLRNGLNRLWFEIVQVIGYDLWKLKFALLNPGPMNHPH